MAALTGCTASGQFLPNPGFKVECITTPATADSNDTMDVSSATVTGGPTFATVYGVWAFDSDTGDAVTATWSSTTITIDASGGTTNHTYKVFVMGV